MNAQKGLIAGVTQLVSVMVFSLILGALLPHSFFENGGWLVGPAAWLGCALLSTKTASLETSVAIKAAVASGLISLVFVLLSLHGVGIVVAIAAFALLCAKLDSSKVAS